MSRRVMCGRVAMGGGAPVSIQSMTNTDTRDAAATLAQVRALAAAGCDIVRISVYDEACARAMREIRDGSPTPLVADVHFDYRLAVLAVENGADKLRINPGNIGGERRVQKVADCARAHGVPIRVGVNSGSVEKELLRRYGGPTPRAMLESALAHVRMLEACGFYDVVVSIKASSVRETVEANRLLARACEYPLHIGVTEAGLPGRGRAAAGRHWRYAARVPVRRPAAGACRGAGNPAQPGFARGREHYRLSDLRTDVSGCGRRGQED